MTCEWCTNDALYGGERPQGATGRQYFAACEQHRYLLARLEYEPIDLGELRLAMRREAKNKPPN